MTTPRERERMRLAKAAKAPADHHPYSGQILQYAHPAGAVTVTVEEVRTQAVVVQVHRVEGMPPLRQKFTKRTDGEYRLAGAAGPALLFPEERRHGDWEYVEERLPYTVLRGYWRHVQDHDAVSTDRGATYWRLSERPRYQPKGTVYQGPTLLSPEVQ